jgi:hypothetical protein
VPLQHWEPGARTVGRCPCGGVLRLIEDHGVAPAEAQCELCADMTGVPHAVAAAAAAAVANAPLAPTDHGVVPGSPEDFGF